MMADRSVVVCESQAIQFEMKRSQKVCVPVVKLAGLAAITAVLVFFVVFW